MSQWGEGRRVVDLVHLAKNLYCKQCGVVLDLNRTMKETRVGLASVLDVTCSCGLINDVHTDTKHQSSADSGITYHINMIASTNLLKCGVMGYVVQNFFAALEIPLPPICFDTLSLESPSEPSSSSAKVESLSVNATGIAFGTELTQEKTENVVPQPQYSPEPTPSGSQIADAQSDLWPSIDVKSEENTAEVPATTEQDSQVVVISDSTDGKEDERNANLDNNIDDNKDGEDDDGAGDDDDDDGGDGNDNDEDNDFSVPVRFAPPPAERLDPAPDVVDHADNARRKAAAFSNPVKRVNSRSNSMDQRVTVQNTAMIFNSSSTDKPYGCGVCFKAYVSEELCRLHIQTHIGDKPFLCEDCGRGFVCEYNLKLHKRQHTGERPFRCEDCGRGFIRWFTLKRHQQKHQGIVHFTCPVCGDAFSSRESLKRHKRVHTGEKPFSCDQCDKTFRGESNLYAHRRRHFGIKPYKCSECEAAFVESTHLTRHRRTHTREQPYICETCGARYTQSGSLAAHRKKHTGEPKNVKVLQCADCGKMFNSYTQLKRHKRIHTGEKPYICEFCQTAFTQSSSLKAHRRIHTGERPFKCEMCGESFLYPRTLKRHLKKHNEGENT